MTPTLVRPLPSLPQLSTCTLCPLHAVARSVGIPLHYLPFSLPPSPTTPALLIIGQNPGITEDLAGTPFIGKSGHILQLAYIRAHALHTLASIYLTNTCRCYHRDGDGPTNAHYRACRPHLLDDLHHLLGQFDGRGPASLTLLTLGAPATTHTYAILGRPRVTLTSAFSHQGATFPCPPSNPSPPPSETSSPTPASPKPKHASASKSSETSSTTSSNPSTSTNPTPTTTCSTTSLTIFSTFHPAAVDRANNLIHAVSGHLTLLRSHLLGEMPVPSTPLILSPKGPP